MAKKKQLIEQPAEMHGVQTYAALTAEGIFKSFNLNFSKQEIEAQLQADKSFYKQVLNLPAQYLHNQILIEHCRELEDIFQQEFLELKLYQLRKHEQNPDVKSKSLLDESIEKLEPSINQYADNLVAQEKQAQQHYRELRELSDEFIAKWQAMHQQNAANLTQALRAQGLDLSDDFEQRLYRRLDQLAADVELPEEALKNFKIKGKADPIQKAVAATLLEEVNNA